MYVRVCVSSGSLLRMLCCTLTPKTLCERETLSGKVGGGLPQFSSLLASCASVERSRNSFLFPLLILSLSLPSSTSLSSSLPLFSLHHRDTVTDTHTFILWQGVVVLRDARSLSPSHSAACLSLRQRFYGTRLLVFSTHTLSRRERQEGEREEHRHGHG